MRWTPGDTDQEASLDMPASHPHRVLIVYPFMPHYRYGIFKALDDLPTLECAFASDPNGENGIEPMAESSVRRHHLLRTRRLSGGMWQSGLLKLAAFGSFESAIFLGDASHLSTWLASAVLRVRGKRVLFWTIGWHTLDTGPKKFVRLIFYRLANVLLLYGNVARELGIQLGYPESRMKVIYNSLSARAPLTRADIPEEIHDGLLVSSFPIIGAVIRLTSVKRLNLLILAASELGRRGQTVTVVLAGSGPTESELADLALSEGVDLRLAGPVYSESALAAIYGAMAVTVVPSAVGLTAIQSMAHGVPVVSDDNPDTQMPEWEAIRPGVTGEHYSAGDAISLADAVARSLGRVARDGQKVEDACREEVALRWSPSAQLPLIADEILGRNLREGPRIK